jgi:electron transfer flavoprotein beta subunit
MNMKITVLVSAGKHPVSGQPRHCRNDSLALQIGLNLTQNLAGDLKVLHAGEPNNTALQDYLALGAKQIDVIPADNVVENLAAQLKNVDLVLTGTRAENGEDSGLLPYLLAAKLNMPVVADALEITMRENKLENNQLEILQFLPKGQRRRVLVSLPAVVAVHPSAAVTLNFIYARQNLGSISTLSASNATTKPSQWHLEKARKPIKLVASTTLTGHERLMASISSKAKGGAVVNEGNNVEKAQVILAYLREHQLIDF